MITLKTLSTATAQEVFDQSAGHLLSQVKRSAEDCSGCRYRAGSLKCAAGVFISDEEYTSEIEGALWETLMSRDLVPDEHSSLIFRLQAIHDTCSPEAWSQKLQELAQRENLEWRF